MNDAPALKGFGHGGDTRLADKQRADLDLSWYYGWSAGYPGTPKNFVPQIWGGGNVGEGLATVKRQLPETKATHLLGFNEPDLHKQSMMTVSKAVGLWPRLEATGLRLGAPATIKPNAEWLESFMIAAERQHRRIDFLPVHIYGWPNAEDFLDKLEAAHRKYQRPIWVTEYAVADFKADAKTPNRYTRAQTEQFMVETVAGMREMSYVERFAWKTRASGDIKMGTSTLFHTNGSLTSTGRLYASL